MDNTESRYKTGSEGLDEILGGGLPGNRIYVVQGEPGTGKTTLSLQFLMEGIKNSEEVLYITFSETKDELAQVARSHKWNLDKIHLIDLSTLEEKLTTDTHSSLFHPSEIELSKMTDILMEEIVRIKPSRVVFDSVSEMRLLAESPLRYRRQILALKQAFAGRKMTVYFLDDLTVASQDLQVQSIAHGVIGLYRINNEFGGERRRLRVLKLRGVNFTGGYHDYIIESGGLKAFPRMVAADYAVSKSTRHHSSGIEGVDKLLGGGIDGGTSNLIIGPAGTGKSTLALKYASEHAKKGKPVVYFAFEESIANISERGNQLGLDITNLNEQGLLRIIRVNPAELSPGQFASNIRNLVENEKLEMVVIDSLNGYLHAMPQEQYLSLQLHELLSYLNNKGVVTILVLTQQGMIGFMQSPVDLTYLADTIILTRFFEYRGSVKKAVSVIKKRTGNHENTIREFIIGGKDGVEVGPILENFQGVLTGVPQYFETKKEILNHES